MKTITIPEHEYKEMQATIETLKKQLAILKDQQFLQKLQLAYHLLIPQQEQKSRAITLERGSAKHLIQFMADDFDAPLEDFKEYM